MVPKVLEVLVPKVLEVLVPKVLEVLVPKVPEVLVPKVPEVLVPKVREGLVPKVREGLPRRSRAPRGEGGCWCWRCAGGSYSASPAPARNRSGWRGSQTPFGRAGQPRKRESSGSPAG